MTISPTAARTRRRRKALAIASGGIAVGLAAVATLAAWTDQEWVFGGTGPGGAGDPGVGTSSFEVVQNAWETTAPTAAQIVDNHETNTDANDLVFNVDPGSLTPGSTIYAPVALRTTDASIGGTLDLQAPVEWVGGTKVDAGDSLWAALRHSVKVTASATTAANCTPAGWSTAGTAVIAADTPLTAATPAATTETLAAAGGNVQYYCFQISLPDTTANQALQGRKVFPAWRFAATSS